MRVRAEDWRTFAFLVLDRAGVRSDVAPPVVNGLCETSLRGVDSHGIRLFPHYVRAVQGGRINPAPAFRFLRRLPACGDLDADHTFGHAAGSLAMRHAMDMAREVGMGAVAVRNSTHFGAAACYALQAAREGFLAFSFTHADALLLSHGGTRAFFGTNPVCFAAPADGEEPFCVDMGVSLRNWNWVLQRREAGDAIPPGVAATGVGESAADPNDARSLFPIGEHKGYALAAMVEVLCSLLTGMPFGRDLPPMFTTPMSQKRHLGHFFMAIRPEGFVEAAEFPRRMKDLMAAVRSEPPQPGREVMLPGDPEKKATALRSRDGIPVDPLTWKKFGELAAEFGVPVQVAR